MCTWLERNVEHYETIFKNVGWFLVTCINEVRSKRKTPYHVKAWWQHDRKERQSISIAFCSFVTFSALHALSNTQ